MPLSGRTHMPMCGHTVPMDPVPERKPLLPASGCLRLDDFCLNTGLDRDTVEDLVRTGRLQGWLWTSKEPIRPWSVFYDALPSRAALVALGLPVREDYDPQALRTGPLSDDTLRILTEADPDGA
jgi:hypothetical protein